MSHVNFSSLPPEQEASFVVFEQKMEESAKSGVTAALIAAGAVFLLAIGIFLVWTTLVDTACLALGSHWPSDVLAGFVIGLAWLATIIFALRRAERTALEIRE